MKNKNIVIGAVLVAVFIGIGMYFSSPPANAQGKVVFGISDAAPDMGSISSVLITVNKVDMHNESSGWVTVSNEIKQYDLLALKKSGAVSLLASVNVDAGTYDQVRLMVSKVVVVKDDIQTEAKLPSGELKIVGNIIVGADKTSSVVFDFLADKSLHLTGNGKFIFAPVIKITKTNEASVEVKSNNELNITNGKKENDEDVGMDEKGEIKSNFELKGNFKLDEEDNIKLEGEVKDSIGDKNQGDNDDKDNVETDNEVTLNFTAQNNSKLSGTATVSKNNGGVKVALKFKNDVLGLLAVAKPAHIHLGSCANIGAVKYPLNSVVNGKSETTLNVSMPQLKTMLPLAINVHKSATESSIYVACTNINL